MSSNFGWVDFASENRKKMMNVVRLFREKETLDELGIGTIRDAFANYFFPGTSTIQTRAKYMLFIPWIYQKIEKREITYPEVTKRARRYEIRLIHALLKSDDQNGIIGQEARDTLKRLPSEIYWAGLYSWGIRLNPSSISQYHRTLTKRYYRKKRHLNAHRDEPLSKNWDPGLPPCPKDLFNYAEFKLDYHQAEYLEDRIACNHNNSLLFFLINHKNEEDRNYFWQLPMVNKLPDELKENITHAQNFSETIHGAFIYYNYLLAEAREDPDLIDEYYEILEDWKEKLYLRWGKLQHWYNNFDNFWTCRPLLTNQIAHSTRSFVKSWYDIIFKEEGIKNLQDNREARLLIKNREKQKKGQRARLHNPRALEMWTGRSGTNQLDYRWQVIKIIITDIIKGLKER